MKILRELKIIICKGHNCNETFLTNNEYLVHKNITHKANVTKVKCEICKWILKWKYVQKRHMTKHNTDKNFKCKECGKSFKSPTSMKEHSRAHKGILCVPCKDCDEMFISQGAMLTHKTNSTSYPAFICVQFAIQIIATNTI